MPSGEVDRSEEVGILAKDSRSAGRCPRLGTLDRFRREYPGLLALGLPPRQSRRRVPTSREEALQALAYGHCGKKFAAKVPGEV